MPLTKRNDMANLKRNSKKKHASSQQHSWKSTWSCGYRRTQCGGLTLFGSSTHWRKGARRKPYSELRPSMWSSVPWWTVFRVGWQVIGLVFGLGFPF